MPTQVPWFCLPPGPGQLAQGRVPAAPAFARFPKAPDLLSLPVGWTPLGLCCVHRAESHSSSEA